jgi:hypothetical protein
MSNQFIETRGMLAKLLATENLIVEHNHTATTASFNTETRVLRLPVLKTDNENVYNMFVAHECAHALETPVKWKDDIPDDVPSDFVNVIEDIRIERYIQDKFPGLRSDFARGYNKLNDDDFFRIRDKDLTKFSLIDRINLHFKLGSRAFIPFTDEEMVYVRAAGDADTWDKVVLASKMICEYVKGFYKDEKGDEEIETETDSQNGENGSESKLDNGGGSDDSEPQREEPGDVKTDIPDEFVSQTQEAFDESMSGMADTNYGRNDITYLKYDEVNLDDIIVNIDKLRESVIQPDKDYYVTEFKNELKQYLHQIKGDVNFMVQQFEMKKSADAYARASQHKTGVLNTNLLHNYKISDDLFLRQTITPEGKCHGMVMYLDWSGSMCEISMSTVKQIIVLTQFCRKVQIPFDVYLFTTAGRDREFENFDIEQLDGTFAHHCVGLIQVLTSTSSRSDMENDMLNLWCAGKVSQFNVHTQYVPFSPYFQMGGTPLDNALILVPQIIKEFRQKTGAQKVSFVCVTDGESSPIHYFKKHVGYDDRESVRTTYSYYEKVMIRSGSKVFPVDTQRGQSTGDVINWVKSQVEDVYISNIFLGKMAKSSHHLFSYGCNLNEKQFRKTGMFTTESSSWPLIGVINPQNFGDAKEEIEIEDGATKAQIKSALNKMLKSKQSSRLILQQLVSQFS